MRSLFFALLGWLATQYILGAETPKLPIYEMGGSFAEYIDKNGYISPLAVLGNINFGGSLSFPLLINFSSTLRTPSAEFGQGWECPLFDAKTFDVQKNLKKIETLGGKELFLVYNPRTETWKHFYTDNWTGKENGPDFELTYLGAYKFTFHDGLISSLSLPGGRTILWDRQGDKLVSISEKGKSPVAKLVYDKLGFAKEILLNPDSLGNSKKEYTFTSDLIYAGINSVHCPDGRALTFERSRDKLLNPILKWTDNKGPSENFSWDIKTGKIISDSDYTYQMNELLPDRSYPKMMRKSKITGKTETFYFDPKHGTTDLTLADGTLKHIEMVIAPGPNYKQIRLVQETKNGKTRTILRRSFDDQGHLLLEATGLAMGREDIRQYVYDDAGRVTTFLWNGKEMWKNIYDPSTGQLRERDLSNLGLKLTFDPLPGGQMKEIVEKKGGVIASTKTLAPTEYSNEVISLQRIE